MKDEGDREGVLAGANATSISTGRSGDDEPGMFRGAEEVAVSCKIHLSCRLYTLYLIYADRYDLHFLRPAGRQ